MARTTLRSSTPASTASLDTVKNSVDFAVIKDAMAEFQKVYVEKTVEIPLYYRKNVELVGAEARQLLRQPDAGRSDLECGRLVRQSVTEPDPSGV